MRLQVVQLLFCCLGFSSVAIADKADAPQGQARSRVFLYADDDATTVITTTIDAQQALPNGFQLGAHVLLDAVSSASIDVVSAATERWTENRGEIGIRGKATMAKVDLGLGVTRSLEEDWSSTGFQVGAGRDFLQRNLRVEASYGLVLNHIGRAEDPVFDERMTVHQAELGISQLVDEASRVGAAFSLQRNTGFQSSPYRYVSAADGSAMAEHHPNRRLRYASSVFAQRSLVDWVSARGAYRFYWDDWGIRSHTASMRLSFDGGGRFAGALSTRLYQQSEAAFYRKEYASPLKHMTNDRELSRFWDVGADAAAGAHLGPVYVDAKVGFIYYDFKNFAALESRTALVTGLGARMSW